MLSQNKVDSRMGVKATSRSLIHGHSLDNECIVMAGGFVGGAKRKNAKSIMILIYLKKFLMSCLGLLVSMIMENVGNSHSFLE